MAIEHVRKFRVVTEIDPDESIGSEPIGLFKSNGELFSPGEKSGSLIAGSIPPALLGQLDETELTHTWAVEDLAVDGDFSGALVYLLNWTPTVSGRFALKSPPWDGTQTNAEVDYYIFAQEYNNSSEIAGVSIANAYWFTGKTLTSPPEIVGYEVGHSGEIVAGQVHTLAVINFQGLAAVGRVVSLREWCLSVQPFGGTQKIVSWENVAYDLSHIEGYSNSSSKIGAHAEGFDNVAEGIYSHAEGLSNYVEGDFAHVEGRNNSAKGFCSHVEGVNNLATGFFSHVEGRYNLAQGGYSHAEGSYNYTKGPSSHAEGEYNVAEEFCSHAEGFGAHALTAYSHVRGGGFWGNERGNAQFVSLELVAETTNADPTPLAARFYGTEVVAHPNRVIGFRGLVAARKQDGTLGAAWALKAAARINETGVVTLLGSPNVELLGSDAGASTWSVAISAGTDSKIRVIATGANSTSIHWSCTAEMKEVG